MPGIDVAAAPAAPARLRRPSGVAWFAAAVLLVCALYTALHWTPSSYGLVLKSLGVADTGIVAGTPREIRSDEWSVWTPFVQAAVNNGFERFNATSPYGEDLRNFNALPLLDWALAFKPQYWLFFLADPALAFSFSHAIFIALGLIGYAALLRVFGFPSGWSVAGSVALLFTTYAQFWWTTTGPLLAVFPWLLVVAATPMRPLLKAGVTAYLAAFWLLSHTYPPIVISLGIAGAVALAAFRPDTLRPANLLALAAGAAVGVGVTLLYLGEPLSIMAATAYPGQRITPGGSVEPIRWLAQFFPLLVTRGTASLLPAHNLCEVATGGSYMLLLALVFADHRALAQRLAARSPEGRRLRWTTAVLLAGAALFTAWMLAPVPAEVGRFLLLDRVPPERAVFASGMLLLLIGLTLLSAAPVRITPTRVLFLALAILLAWASSKPALLRTVAATDWRDVAVLIPLAAALLVPRLRASAGVLVGAAAFGNLIATADFNPIQKADPLFRKPETAVTAELDRMAAAHPRGWLVVGGFHGATLNGLGYRSVAHVTIAPQLAFFRERFPEMKPGPFNFAFNRYARVAVMPGDAPPSVPHPDTVNVPEAAFLAPPSPLPVELVSAEESWPSHPFAGYMDSAALPKDTASAALTLHGWGMLDHGARLLVRTSVPAVAANAEILQRPDVAAVMRDMRLIRSGFRLTLTFDRELPPGSPPPTVCIVTQSPTLGTHLLQTPAAPDSCRVLAH